MGEEGAHFFGKGLRINQPYRKPARLNITVMVFDIGGTRISGSGMDDNPALHFAIGESGSHFRHSVTEFQLVQLLATAEKCPVIPPVAAVAPLLRVDQSDPL